MIGRLAPGVTLAQARSELSLLDARHLLEYPEAGPLETRILGLHEDRVGEAATMLYVLLGAVGVVLLIGCVNVANLLLARATTRARELAVRAALGSGRRRLLTQLMLESMLLSGAGCVGGIIAVGRDSVPRLEDTSFDIRVLSFAGGVSVLCALLFGLLPALRDSRAEASGVLRDNSRSVTADRRSNHVRHVLVGGQIALAFVLVSAASILAVSMQRLATVDLGFEPEGLLTFEVHLPEQRYDAVRRAGFHEELAARLRTLPDVVSAGSVSRLPATGTYHSWGTYALTGPRAGDDVIPSEQRVVGGDYFGTLGLEPVAGRVFDARDDAGAPNRVVISRSLAEAAFPGAEAVGQEVRMGGREATIIGVVDDVALTVQGAVAGTVYHPHTQFAENRNWPLTQVVRATGELTPLIRRAAAEIARSIRSSCFIAPLPSRKSSAAAAPSSGSR